MEEFSDLVEQYTPMINRIIRSLMIYKDQDDYFQIGLIALWDAYSLYDPEKGSFLSIAYSMVKGRILHGLRDEAKTSLLVSPFEPGSRQIEDTLITEDTPLQHEYLLAYCEGLTESQKNWVVDFRNCCSTKCDDCGSQILEKVYTKKVENLSK